MVSRRKILSRSRDDLNLDSDNLQDSDPNADLNPYNYRNNRRINLMDTEDDVWYHKDKLYKVSLLSNTHIMNIFFINRPYLSLIQPTTSKKTYIFWCLWYLFPLKSWNKKSSNVSVINLIFLSVLKTNKNRYFSYPRDKNLKVTWYF